jgi:hypothetical protein
MRSAWNALCRWLCGKLRGQSSYEWSLMRLKFARAKSTSAAVLI